MIGQPFLDNPAIQDAVIRRFGIIGEAAKRISDEIKQSYPGIPWRQMAALRDVLIHDYPEIAIDQIWVTTVEELPKLKEEHTPVLEGF